VIFTTIQSYIDTYNEALNKESSFSFQEWVYDNELIEDDIVLNKNLDYLKLCEENIIDRHSYFLSNHLNVVEFSEEEYRKYRCNAHRLAYDLYGTTVLWFLILSANELFSESEFNLHRVKLYDANVVARLVEIKLAENRELELNRASVNRMSKDIKTFFNNINLIEDEYDSE
jgi:hypothetical protein